MDNDIRMESENSEESFLADSDETGDIDLDGIKSQEDSRPAPISAGGDEAVGEEFDYRTSMISSDELNENLDIGEVENDSVAQVIESTAPDNEGYSIGAETKKAAHYDEDELIHAKAVMETVRSQRDKLESENAELKKADNPTSKDKESLKEEKTEAKIEASIFKQKFDKLNAESADSKNGINDNLRIAEAKIRNLKAKVESMKTSFIVDKQSISKREKDLESKIELMEIDIASQLKSREDKILELKRKIETLEFNMETTLIQNQGLRENKKMLIREIKLVSESLRGAGRVLDESIDFEVMFEDDDTSEQAS